MKVPFYCGAYVSVTLAPTDNPRDEAECTAEWEAEADHDDLVYGLRVYYSECPKCGSTAEAVMDK